MSKNKLKKIGQGQPMPDDFWNYNVNPITGYYIPRTPSKKHKER